MTIIPKLINVQLSYDDRGKLVHYNEFNFQKKKLRDFIKLKIIKLILYVLGTSTNMKKNIF